jgi:hypothetical protein
MWAVRALLVLAGLAIAGLALAGLALAAAAERTEPRRLAPADLPPSHQPALHRAAEGVRAAACEVERRFGEGDPDANAARCDGAAAVPGVEVGRTSARLRNPANAPPPWAEAYLAATDGKKAAEVAEVAFDLGDRVGLLRPIEIRKRCLGCHASREKLSSGTREWLARAYPRDRALGYALGDLRGFWWAEAPVR